MTIRTKETTVITNEQIVAFKLLDPEVKEEALAQLPKFKKFKYRSKIGMSNHSTEDGEDIYDINVRYESISTPLGWIAYVAACAAYGYAVCMIIKNAVRKIENNKNN